MAMSPVCLAPALLLGCEHRVRTDYHTYRMGKDGAGQEIFCRASCGFPDGVVTSCCIKSAQSDVQVLADCTRFGCNDQVPFDLPQVSSGFLFCPLSSSSHAAANQHPSSQHHAPPSGSESLPGTYDGTIIVPCKPVSSAPSQAAYDEQLRLLGASRHHLGPLWRETRLE